MIHSGAVSRRQRQTATLKTAESRGFQTMLRDLSLSGFSASAIDQIPVGSTCSLTSPDHEAKEARVVWWDRALVGCAFEKVIARVTQHGILEPWEAEASRQR
jgi:hypothetical protein